MDEMTLGTTPEAQGWLDYGLADCEVRERVGKQHERAQCRDHAVMVVEIKLDDTHRLQLARCKRHGDVDLFSGAELVNRPLTVVGA